ncbi:MAG: hypothetical protein GEU28_04450 [Dehalococcoidia bacterium]|nr:hypothetical protein [Dehalococcoidia bacterium]
MLAAIDDPQSAVTAVESLVAIGFDSSDITLFTTETLNAKLDEQERPRGRLRRYLSRWDRISTAEAGAIQVHGRLNPRRAADRRLRTRRAPGQASG